MLNSRHNTIFAATSFFLGLFLAASPSFATSEAQLRRLMTVDGNGRISCVKVDEPDDDPMVIQQSDLVNQITSYAPGHKSAELTRVLGKPRIVEKSLSLNVWPKSTREAQEVWLYRVGTPGWGLKIALCFTNDKCTDVVRLTYEQQSAYDKWKTDQISNAAPGKESVDIIKTYGEPDFRKKETKPRTVQQGAASVEVDETWDYCILDGQGVRLGFRNGKCVAIEIPDN